MCALSIVELLKAIRTESAVTGPGVGFEAPATGEPQEVLATATAATTNASVRQ
jgi:hypothetical protein